MKAHRMQRQAGRARALDVVSIVQALLLAGVSACTAAPAAPAAPAPAAPAVVDDGKHVFGNDDRAVLRGSRFIALRSVNREVPELTEYVPLLKALGVLLRPSSSTCNATHVGNGIMLTAGHCMEASPERRDGASCAGYRVRLENREYPCVSVLASQHDRRSMLDYAIFEIAGASDLTRARFNIGDAPPADARLVMFSYYHDPLDIISSGVCSAVALDLRFPAAMLAHSCDSHDGASGSAIFAGQGAGSAEVTGIHSDHVRRFHWGTRLASTPLREFLGRL